MKILLVGSGGREHAIAWKLAKSEKVSKVFVAPGNGGTATTNKCENVNITDLDELVVFARENNIAFTFVGPEDPLTKGITDKFKAAGLRCFGPDSRGAQLEGSKAFSKDFMKKYGVKTAQYGTFTEYDKAKAYLENCEYPIVIKADGLAALTPGEFFFHLVVRLLRQQDRLFFGHVILLDLGLEYPVSVEILYVQHVNFL